MRRISMIIVLLIAAVAIPAAADCVNLANVPTTITNDLSDLDSWAILFNCAATGTKAQAQVAAQKVQLRLQDKSNRDGSIFKGFLGGGSAAYAYGAGLALHNRHLTNPDLDNLLLNVGYKFEKDLGDPCGFTGMDQDDTGTFPRWERGNTCMEDYSVAAWGFAWHAAYLKAAGDARWQGEADSAVTNIVASFSTDDSLCIYDGTVDSDSITTRGPCRAPSPNLVSNLVPGHPENVLALNHGQENANYGLGLLTLLADAYEGLDLAGVNASATAQFQAKAGDIRLLTNALFLRSQQISTSDGSRWVSDQCFFGTGTGHRALTRDDMKPDNRNRPCYDRFGGDTPGPGTHYYQPAMYPVFKFISDRIVPLSPNNGAYNFDGTGFPTSSFTIGEGDDINVFFGWGRYTAYYLQPLAWWPDKLPAAFSCEVSDATITAPATVGGGATAGASVPSTPGATYSWSIQGGTITAGGHSPNVTFIANDGGNVNLTVQVTAPCGTVNEGSATIQILGPFLHVDEKFVASGVQAQYTATLLNSGDFHPVANVLLDFTVLGVPIGSATTDKNGVATIIYTLNAPAGFLRDAIKVTVHNDPTIPAAFGNITINCAAGAYTVVPDTLNVTSKGVTDFVFNMTTTCDFTAEPDSASGGFIHVTKVDPQAGTFTVTVDPTTTGARAGAIFAGGVKRVAINQSGATNCNFSFSPALSILPDTPIFVSDPDHPGQFLPATTPINIAAPPGCHWDVVSSADWLVIVSKSPSDQTGPGTVNVYATTNSGAARTGFVSVVDGVTSTGLPARALVNQSAPPPCTTAQVVTRMWGGGNLSNLDQDVVVGIGATGTHLAYDWTITGYADNHVDHLSGSNQVIIRSGNPGYPALGQTLTYHVSISNECTSGIDGGSVTYTNTSDAACNTPFILGHPGVVVSPKSGANVFIGVDARDCKDTIICGFDPGDLTYQWYAGTTGDHRNAIPGAIHSGLTVSPTQIQFYWCEVSRQCLDANNQPILDTNGNPITVKSQSGTAEIIVPPAIRPHVASHDFTGDTLNDLVWHNPTTGQTELWQMAGTNHASTIPMTSNNADLQAIGDFNADGKPDLVWRDPQTGANTVWNMSGTLLSSVGTLESRTGSDWVIGASADLDGDNHHDLVWHNNDTGENEIWFLNGTTHTGTWALPQNPDGNWGLHGAADFNGDTKADLFLHNRVTGENQIWLMNDATLATIASTGQTTPVRQFTATVQSIDSLPDPNWVPAQVVDLDGDGKPDIVWRNTSTGENMVWLMNGVTHVSTAQVESRPDTTWQIGGGGSTNSSPGPVSGTRATTSLSVTAAPANLNTATTITATLSANGAPLAGKTINFSVNGQSVAQLVTDANGSATAGASVAGLNTGTYPNAVTVSFDGDANDLPSSVSADLVITGIKPDLTWSNPASIVYGTPLSAVQLNATANVAGTFAYLPAAGTILNAGYNLLSVKFTPADASVAPIAANTIIFVTKGTPAIAWSSPASIPYGTRLTPAQLNATANVPGTFTYDPPLDTLLGLGTQTLNVTFTPQTTNYDIATATTTINVTQGTQSIVWGTPAPIVYLQPLTVEQLNAFVSVTGTAPGGTLTYNPTIGTILTAGVHTLTVNVASTAYYAAASATVQIVVEPAEAPITWGNPAAIVYGTPLSATQLNATSSVSGSFAYSPATGTILNAGNSQLLAVTFTPSDPNYTTATAFANIDVIKAQQTITWLAPAPIVYGTPLSSTQLNATATAGALTYNPPTGTILSAGDGQTLTVTAAATANYNAATAAVTIDVKKAHPVITWATPAPIVYGTLLSATQLNATANVAGTFTYTPAAGTKLNAGSQTLSVLFTPTDTNNYETASASVTLVVQRATPVITWSQPAGIVYGTALDATQLNATADVAGTFAYTPAAGTILNAGASQTLSVHFTPNDTGNYSDAAATTTIDVAKAKQTLSWSAPASIVYGTALSGTQLNATVTVVGPAAAGALVYTPAAGTVLDAGGHTLTVTAQETPNYVSATTSVTIDVNRAPLSLVVDAKSKLYGAVLPTLSGTLTGVMNNDPITPAYATTATPQSIAGTYPITATLLDPNHRLFNYDVTITPSTLTVLPAPLLISANAATKQYSDPLPQLTATFTGFVLGETPSALSGALSITTAATRLSAPGAYPISIGGLTSSNYAITYAGSTFTVTPEDARVTITSPTLVSPSTITLSATVKDFDDGFPGDIRNASLTFIDRTTLDVLCTATIVLFDPADQRTGVASCTFTHSTPGTITVGARVGNYYTRDDVADDATVTIVVPTTDSITGSGATTGGAFNLNLQYDKDDAVKGSFTFRYVQNNHTYEITATSLDSLGIARTTNGGKAAIVGVATLRDVTSSVTLDSAARLIATATDDGEPSNDGLSITLLKSGGGVWLATAWNGTTAVEQSLTSGNIQVHYGK